MLYLLATEGTEAGHGAAHEGAGHGINPLDFADPANWAASLWALGIFVALVLVLRKFAWGPIVAGLAAREKRISDSLEQAAAIEKATRELAESNKKMLEEAQREAQAIIAESRTAAKAAAADIQAKAQAEIEAQRDRAKRELSLEVDKARAEIRAQTVDLTLLAAGKLLGRALTADDQRRLAEQALGDAAEAARN